MSDLETFVPLVGFVLCTLAVCQLAFWTNHSWRHKILDKETFDENVEKFRQQLTQVTRRATHVARVRGNWRGYRDFRVYKIERETNTCTSVYLVAADGKPIPAFQPGQHLICRFQIPDQQKPVVRCYSLSDQPGLPHYRISVKQVPAPANNPHAPAGCVSTYINQHLKVGDQLAIKAPAGDFYYPTTQDHDVPAESDRPLVLLAGGIGITPILSIIEYLAAQNSERTILLAYGVSNGNDHPFKQRLHELNQQHDNFNLLTCYSQPLPTDRLGDDYLFAGRISVEVLKQVLPSSNCDYYLCGPPTFMKSLYDGLIDWNVPPEQIRFEAFGPSTIQPPTSTSVTTTSDDSRIRDAAPVLFASSKANVVWDGTHRSLLELAEAHQIPIDSGCRAGNCGTCSVALISGKVVYPGGKPPACEPGQCLTCIGCPDGPVELGA